MYKTEKLILYVLEENLRYTSFLPVIYICLCLNFDLVQLSGFKMEVIETAYAGHAKVLSSSVDLEKFPDGNIKCVSFFFLFLAITFLSISLFKMLSFFFSCLQVLYVLVAMGLSMRLSLFLSFVLSLWKMNWNTILLYCTCVDIFFAYTTYKTSVRWDCSHCSHIEATSFSSWLWLEQQLFIVVWTSK